MKKKLIITIHDFGISHSVNKGLIYAASHKNNIARQISIIATTVGSDNAVTVAKKYLDEFPLGLNIALTVGKPLIKNHKTLVDTEGKFYKPDLEKWDFTIFDTFDQEEIKREIDAQYTWFLEKFNKKPNVLCTPKSEHGDPKVLIPFVDKAKEEGLPIRTPAWEWYENYAAQAYVKDMGVTCNDKIILTSIDWGGRFGFDLETQLDALIDEVNSTDGIVEILVFCGFMDQELMDVSSMTWQRGHYLNILERRGDIIDRIKEEFEIISYNEI